MAKRVKKKTEPETQIAPIAVTIYKVVIAPYYSYYTRTLNPILKVSFSIEDAQKFIQEYPYFWIKPFLSIETETRLYRETD